MQTLTFENAKAHLAEVCDRACREGETFVVTRRDHHDVVLMSLEGFNAGRRRKTGAGLLALLATLEPIPEPFPDVDEGVLPVD